MSLLRYEHFFVILLVVSPFVNTFVAAQTSRNILGNHNESSTQILNELSEIRKIMNEQTSFSFRFIIQDMISIGIPVSATFC
jgi:hypothetical protein